jgi:orotidine-5'-phosphate decarboxylase
VASVKPIPIVALDVPGTERAKSLVRDLGDTCSFYKVGGELFTSVGPGVVEWLRAEGKLVFLDLKFHDIPNTVKSASRAAAACGASLITVHGIGGSAMIAGAVDGAGADCGVLAVTVLTSLDAEHLSHALGRTVTSVSDEVSRVAALARSAGAHGVVCSGHESSRIVQEHGGQLATLVPGVRLPGDSANDQSRVVTPSDAARAAASYIILGRTVTAASDPAFAMRQVSDELSAVQT